jgi:hypothetical protein
MGVHVHSVAAPTFRQVLPTSLYLHLRDDIRLHVPSSEQRRHGQKRSPSSTATRHDHTRRGGGQDVAMSLQASDRCQAVYKSVDPFHQFLVFPPNSAVHGHLVGRQGTGHLDLLIEPQRGLTRELLYHAKNGYTINLIVMFTGPHGTNVSMGEYEHPDGGERLRHRFRPPIPEEADLRL